MKYADQVLDHYGIKTAGGTAYPLMKNIKVTPRRIKKVCYDTVSHPDGITYLDGMDWRKVEFDKPEKNPYRPNGTLVWWRVYPAGEVGNKQSDYIYGYVMTEWTAGPKGIEIQGDIVMKH